MDNDRNPNASPENIEARDAQAQDLGDLMHTQGFGDDSWPNRCTGPCAECCDSFPDDRLVRERDDMNSKPMLVMGKPRTDLDCLKDKVEAELKAIEAEGKSIKQENTLKYNLRVMYRARKEALAFLSTHKDVYDETDNDALVRKALVEDDGSAWAGEVWADVRRFDPNAAIRLEPAITKSKLLDTESHKRCQPLIEAIRKGGFKSRFWLFRQIASLGLNKAEQIKVWKTWNSVNKKPVKK